MPVLQGKKSQEPDDLPFFTALAQAIQRLPISADRRSVFALHFFGKFLVRQRDLARDVDLLQATTGDQRLQWRAIDELLVREIPSRRQPGIAVIRKPREDDPP